MAYDSKHKVVILFGGNDGANYLNDTWRWDGTTWTQLHPLKSPSARSGLGSLSDDPALHKLVLFGGFDSTGELGDTWLWTGTNWKRVKPPASPTPSDPGLAYSSGLKKVVLFGGYDGTNWLKATWTFDGTTWTQLSPLTSPPARAGEPVASFRSGVALFGGFNNGNYMDDTWRFTGTTWKKVKSLGPSARSAHGFAFDPALGGGVLFGGRNLNIPQYYGDTWLLN